MNSIVFTAYLAGGVLLVAAAQGQAPASFTAGGVVPVAHYGASLAVGDLDGDGDLDFVTGNVMSGTASVRLNDGHGNYSGLTNLNVGPAVWDVALGDVDGDGDLDLLATNSSITGYDNDFVGVYRNDGTGTFTAAGRVGVGNNPFSLALADLDGDGDQDLLVANAASRSVSVRFNDGTGGFGGGSDVVVGGGPFEVVVRDIDHDGDPDLLAACSADDVVAVRLNDGRGQFAGGEAVRVGSTPMSVAVGDVNGDGHPDLVTPNFYSDDVSVRLGDGRGHFGGGSTLAVGAGLHPAYVALGDLNGDGHPDLVTADMWGNSLTPAYNNGQGGFVRAAALPAGSGPYAVRPADVDADGDLDLLVVASGNSAGSSVQVLFNGGRAAGGASDASSPVAVPLLYPNPVAGPAPVRLALLVPAETTTISYTLLNAIGATMATGTLPAANGEVRAELPTTTLAAGLYILRVPTVAGLVSQRLVVQ